VAGRGCAGRVHDYIVRCTTASAFDMDHPRPVAALHQRVVRLWLFAVAALIFAMVLVGGATRLTESGLSIVEWKPVTGTLPPLSPEAWQAEFDKYKAIPQYQQINRGMSLEEFQTIYWWEWTHRQLGRVIGVAFLLPFLWFLWRGWIEPRWRTALWTIFGLGAVQGGVGWWMVASGLAERTSVSQYRLAFHLTLACVIYAAVLWTARRMSRQPRPEMPRRLRVTAIVLLGLVLLQIYLGALVAGLDAGLTYNTWPLIDGQFLPDASALLLLSPLWRNLFENILMVQFDHRMLAYALWAVSLLHVLDVLRGRRDGRILGGAVALALAVTLQAAIGILTLLHQVPLGLGLLHQGMAVVVLTIAVAHAEQLVARTREAIGGVVPAAA
jgi:cytochrome c oxidase assembly protein subunit 15